ncbi:diguanylate cyclase domain-containing protein [Amedibacillus sp. YH-ame6]
MSNLLQHMNELIDTVLNVRFTDLEKEKACCLELLELSKQHSYGYATAFAYTYLGDYYLAQNDAMLSGQYLYDAKQLCSKTLYPALYMKVCHLLGFYYHLINDEQNALQFYMESIALAEELKDVYQRCNAWNNIADMFQGHKQYDEAVKYYQNAYQAMLEGQFKDARLLTIVLYNLAEVNGYMDQLNEMDAYLTICEDSEIARMGDTSFHTFCCRTGRLLEAAFQGNKEKAKEISEEIIERDYYGVDDRYIIIMFLLHITNALIKLKEKEYAKRYLDILDEYGTMNEISFIRRLVDLRVFYAESFSEDAELQESYQSYYHTMRKISVMEDDVRVNGMKARIHLQEIILKHETTLKENRRLVDEVHIDDLTNIYNRRYFNQLMEEKDGTIHSLGIIMMDIDYFKEYNDSYGHIHGDLTLRMVGDTLNRYSHDGIIPCRYGGDEFACFCKNQSNEEIEKFIHAVRSDLAAQNMEHKQSKCSQQITLSIGYANCDGQTIADTHEVLRLADKAMYCSKERGRNTWTRYVEEV